MLATSRYHHLTQNDLEKSPFVRHNALSHHLYRKTSSLKPPAVVSAAASVRYPAETLLKEACRTRQIPPEQVVEALETLEKQQCSVQAFPTCLQGTWRLLFAVPAPIPSWAYVPVVEDAIIDINTGMLDLKSFVGPFCFTFSGSARFVPPQKQQQGQQPADMVFSFDSFCVEVFGFKYASERVPKEKTYSFFYVDKGIAAANSSLTGGKVLMCRADVNIST